MRSLGIHWNTSMTKERLDISLFRLTNGVSLGHTCCSFFHVGKVSMSPSYGSIGIGMSRIVSTWNVHHWLHYCFHISQQFIVSKETGTTESLPLSHISVIPHFLFIKRFFLQIYKRDPCQRTNCLMSHGSQFHHQVVTCSRWLIGWVALTRDSGEPSPGPGLLF